MSGEDKRNKSIIKSIIHNNASFSVKVFWSESGEKSAQIKQRLQDKAALNKYVTGEQDFGGNVIMDYGLIF